MGLLKNFLIGAAIAFGVNVVISGPEQVVKRLKSFYERPELTVYPLKCVFGNCIGATAKCMINTPCRRTIGNRISFFFIKCLIFQGIFQTA